MQRQLTIRRSRVFTVSFTALADATSDVLSINSRFTAAEAYAGAELQILN